MANHLRNVCIIAHVDHGKTTLIDHLLKQVGTFRSHEQIDERVMDSMDLERERGITIAAKNTSLLLGDQKINVVDTPGHADFGGEVERVMDMVDGSILLVDAAEGPLPQTRFVLEKSLAKGHRIILCINKVDRPEVQGTGRIDEVVDKTFDLFVELGATDKQADFPIVYACARDGWCTREISEVESILTGKKEANLKPLIDLMVEVVPPPQVEAQEPARLLITNLDYSEYVGQLAVGRLSSGTLKKAQQVCRHFITDSGEPTTKTFQISRLYAIEGLKRVEVPELLSGDIGLVAGCSDVQIGDTIAASADLLPLPRVEVEKPTLRMVMSVNTSPTAGKEGEAIQSRKLLSRLQNEVRRNVALRLEDVESGDQICVLGRGELQFAILIEQMRREGFEFMVGRPAVVFKDDEQGQKLEPIEEVLCDLPESFSGDITDLLQRRKGVLTSYESLSSGKESSRVRLQFEIPTRGLLGIRSKFLTLTRGEGIMNTKLKGYAPFKGEITHRINGSLVADRGGSAVEYALAQLDDRGTLFISPGTEVYEGMIIGECAKENDINVNPCKEKKLTNVRSVMSDGLTMLQGTRKMSLEQCLEWIDDDEWIEFTPESVRLRKKILPQNQRSVIRKKRQ